MTNKPHHSTIMHMYADGAKIQVYNPLTRNWMDTKFPDFCPDRSYRVKLETKKVTVVVLRLEDKFLSISHAEGEIRHEAGYIDIVINAPLHKELANTQWYHGWTPIHRNVSVILPEHLGYISPGIDSQHGEKDSK